MGERIRIEGAVPAGRVEGQDATSEPVSVEDNFAGGEPQLSAKDCRDGLAEQGTAGGHEHHVKIDQFQAFIPGLSLAERFRVLGSVANLMAARPSAKEPTIRSAVGLSRGNSGSGALSRGNFRSAGGEISFDVASQKFLNLGPVEFHAPPVMTREEQVAREMQEHETSAVATQDKTEASSAGIDQVIPHADVTDFAQISSDAQPGPTSKTLVTRSSSSYT